MASCACQQTFVVESCDLATGIVRSVLHPVSMDWQTTLNGGGQGSLTLATKDILVRDVWPHLTSVYISRIRGKDASGSAPVAEFAGIVEKVDATESGTTQVGLVGIEQYLNHRTIKQSVRYDQRPQTNIGRALVDLARPNGIPLFAQADSSQIMRDRDYKGYSRKVIWEAVEQLTQVINGPEWELVHAREQGRWSTTMVFRDQVGLDRGVHVRSDEELSAYALEVDAADHATYVDAIGSGEEEDQVMATAIDRSGIYPQFDAAPAWKDVSRITTLQQHADGHLATYREPSATPKVTLPGIDEYGIPEPVDMRLGDPIEITQNFGALTFRGHARIIDISWAVTVDHPPMRTYETLPLTRASDSVLNQEPTDNCRECD